MNNFIYYYYNIKIDDIKYHEKYYTFTHNGYTHRLYITRDNINQNFIIELNQKLLGNTLINEIILNKNKEIISTIDNKNYILMKIYINPNKKITLMEINYLANKLKIKNKKTNWAILWSKKIDYLEKVISENGKKYPIMTDSFNYFIGMTENAISYYNNIILDKDYDYVISHKIIKFNDKVDVIYNPLNIIFDYRVRDLAEYIKNSFFNNTNISNELSNYFKNYPLTTTEAKLLVSRLLYPSFYFELYEDILIDKKDEKIIINIIDRIDEYEKYLANIIEYLRKKYGIEEIAWLKEN